MGLHYRSGVKHIINVHRHFDSDWPIIQYKDIQDPQQYYVD